METLQPYLSYLGIGAAIVALLLWIGFAAMLSTATEGIPKLLGKFFNYLAMGDLETAYSFTSARFQQSISQKQLQKLVSKHQINKHKRLLLPVSLPEGDTHAFDVTLILTSDRRKTTRKLREIPISILHGRGSANELVRQGENWTIDALSFPQSSKQ
jgi:hypothetical protein